MVFQALRDYKQQHFKLADSLLISRYLATISFVIFWDFSMFYQIFFSSQMKRCANITYKHCFYELPHELPKDLRLRILGSWEI